GREVRRRGGAVQPGAGRHPGFGGPASQPRRRALQGEQVRRRAGGVPEGPGHTRRRGPNGAPRLQPREHEVPAGGGGPGHGAAEVAPALERRAARLPPLDGRAARRTVRDAQARSGEGEDRLAQKEAGPATEATEGPATAAGPAAEGPATAAGPAATGQRRPAAGAGPAGPTGQGSTGAAGGPAAGRLRSAGPAAEAGRAARSAGAATVRVRR